MSTMSIVYNKSVVWFQYLMKKPNLWVQKDSTLNYWWHSNNLGGNGLNFAVLIFLSIDKSKYHHESKIRNYVIRPFLKIRFSFGFSWVLIRRANNYFFTLLLLLIYKIVFFLFRILLLSHRMIEPYVSILTLSCS